MCPKGMTSNIFFSAVCLTTNYLLSLDTSYEKLRAEFTRKHSSLAPDRRKSYFACTNVFKKDRRIPGRDGEF
jgi:hypothetical protein